MVTPETPLQALLIGSLVAAVWIDHSRHRIPNTLTGALLVGAICLQVLASGLQGLQTALFGAAIGFGIFLLPYLRKGMAAGDVKLMTAVGAALGPQLVVVAACASLVTGAGVGVALLSYRTVRDDPRADALLLMKFPYASAIAIGTVVALAAKEVTWTL
jgi:prepilin peptidase CpaA